MHVFPEVSLSLSHFSLYIIISSSWHLSVPLSFSVIFFSFNLSFFSLVFLHCYVFVPVSPFHYLSYKIFHHCPNSLQFLFFYPFQSFSFHTIHLTSPLPAASQCMAYTTICPWPLIALPVQILHGLSLQVIQTH